MEFPTEGIFASHLIRGLFYGLGFALVETTWTSLFKDSGDGSLRFAPDLKGHTTWAMVPGSILGGLYGIEPLYLYGEPSSDYTLNMGFRILLFPIVIWLIEIVWGALLFYGCNGTRAWHYKGKWARLNGFVRLDYFIPWLGLGALMELLFWLMHKV